jgi:hypothetical protein
VHVLSNLSLQVGQTELILLDFSFKFVNSTLICRTMAV